MTAEELYNDLLEKAKSFGMVPQNANNEPLNPKGNAIVRKNIKLEAFTNGGQYFGFINKDEATSKRYSDFSFVVFPDDLHEVKYCVVGLVVGSSGFKNDYEVATLPGLRRMFLRLNGENAFFKTSFDDIETTSSALLKEVRNDYPNLSSVIENYKTVLPAARIVDLDDETGIDILYSWLATYADFRGWGTQKQKKEIMNALSPLLLKSQPLTGQTELTEIEKLMEARHYVVLQGAPGTGKTYTANKIAKDGNYDTFFTQFHAETTYSDFVYGLEPNVNAKAGEPQFKGKPGILYSAIKEAQSTSGKVLLIIDEINRANLSNVLGPVFYLFEYQSGKRQTEIEIGDMKIKQLPENLYVIATMNTADRSLAVVDFALRRRFAWYTMRPHIIKAEDGKVFMETYFEMFDKIFKKYATDEELNLQPGQSYFIVEGKTEKGKEEKDRMKERLIYELMPLIKEYIDEGYLLKAKNEFSDLFFEETGKLMYE